jgi:PI-3-kinase-related kinase SMG-1
LAIYDELVKFVGTLDSSISSKLLTVNLSPNLSKYNFSTSRVSLPGFLRGVTVEGVQPIVTCLPTKSKPKKITFRGSDGKLHEYLIKGNENLNIDAGIMQLLKIAQEFTGAPTRSYSVTPIGKSMDHNHILVF